MVSWTNPMKEVVIKSIVNGCKSKIESWATREGIIEVLKLYFLINRDKDLIE